MKEKHAHQKSSIGRRISCLSRGAHIYFKHRFGELGLGHAQGLTLHHICRHGGINQPDLLDKVRLDKSSLTSQLNKLEENGYITREADPEDRRSKRIILTDKTRAIEAELHNIFISWTDILSDGLSEDERDMLILLLDKLQVNASHALRELRKHETTQ